MHPAGMFVIVSPLPAATLFNGCSLRLCHKACMMPCPQADHCLTSCFLLSFLVLSTPALAVPTAYDIAALLAGWIYGALIVYQLPLRVCGCGSLAGERLSCKCCWVGWRGKGMAQHTCAAVCLYTRVQRLAGMLSFFQES